MDLPDIKQLKKISDACRKAGIKVFECENFKITLTDTPPPPSAYKRQKALKTGKAAPTEFVQGEVQTDMPSPEELLYWSAGGPPPGDS